MKYSEEFLVALVMLHGGHFWYGPRMDDIVIFDPGWDENSRYSNGHYVLAQSKHSSCWLYCLRHDLLPDEVSS